LLDYLPKPKKKEGMKGIDGGRKYTKETRKLNSQNKKN